MQQDRNSTLTGCETVMGTPEDETDCGNNSQSQSNILTKLPNQPR